MQDYWTRFWEKVVKSGDCWEWTAAKNAAGYGRYWNELAHRVSYKFYYKTVEDGMLVCHKCDNPSCVKPTHLFVGTPQDNMNDKVSKGRGYFGEEHHSAKLTAAEAQYILDSPKRGSALAAELGVSRQLISLIRKRKIWKSLDTHR